VRKRRRRSQVGQRISPWAPAPSSLQVNVACPVCSRRSWAHRVFDLVPNGCGGLTEAYDRWQPMAVAYRAMRRWPRKPTGERGFFWETVTDWELEAEHPNLMSAIHERFARRMIAWLKLMGYLRDDNG
jgi:hypothetical protein